MNVIYSSEHFSILAYPGHLGLELVDKDSLRILYLRGAFASHFRHAMAEIPEAERDAENIDAFLDDYCAGAAQPIVFQ